MFGILSYEILVFFLTLLALYIYLKIAYRFQWFDQPDEDRKIHTQVKPTSAGLIFMVPVILFLWWIPVTHPIDARLIAWLSLVLLLVGAYDDFKPLSAKFKFFVILMISVYFVYSVFGINNINNINIILLLFYAIGLIWWLNLYNFMDGSDGMAILQAILPMLAYTYLYINFDSTTIMLVPYLLMILLCLLAFLLFNFPKARMFMGDSGSLSVAFILAAFALYGIANEIFGEILVISLHLVFIMDASLTLFMRWKFNHKLTQAHRLHLYQQLINRGYSHAIVSIFYAIFTTIIILVTLYSHQQNHSFSTKISILATETIILSIIWYYLQNKTKFEQFKR